MHYLLFYEVVDHYAERRVPFRAAHLAHAKQALANGDLVLGGAFANPIDGTVLLFRGSSPAAAEAFASADPYVTNGLITNGASASGPPSSAIWPKIRCRTCSVRPHPRM